MYIGLQVGRGVAALLVVLFHATLGAEQFYAEKVFSGFWRFGSIGVDFFFVLSGFIIYYAHIDDKKNLDSALTYIKKRILRIYPPFILITIILLIAYNIFPTLSANSRDIGIITSLFLIPTPPLSPALNVSWTLMHEMLFYTIFIALYINKKILHGFLIIWAILILLVNLTSLDGIIRTFFLNAHNLEFMFGIISAIIIKNNKGNLLQFLFGLFMLIFYVAYLFDLLGNQGLPDNIPTRIYLGITFMLIVTGLCSIDNKIKYPNFLIFMGAASYSIYLIHSPVLSVLNRVAQKITTYDYLNPNIIFLFAVSLSVFIGFLYYLIWEKPVLRIMKGRFL